MFSFFKPKKKEQASGHQETLQKAVEDLRAEFSDDVLERGMAINDKVDRLESVKLKFFQDLLGLTDEVEERLWPLYQGFRGVKVLELHGFAASIVAAAVKSSVLPEHEKLPIIDIYLGLWVDSIGDQYPSLDKSILKGSIDREWQGILPGILRAVADAEAVKMGFPNPPLALAQAIDQLCGVNRSSAEQEQVGVVFKETIVHTMFAVRAL